MNQFRFENEVRFSLNENGDSFLKYLTSRKEQIEMAIDDHLFVIAALGEYDQYSKMTYQDKLGVLRERNGEVQAKKDRMRLKGLTQSYDMLDSEEFHHVKHIKNIIQWQFDMHGTDFSKFDFHLEAEDDNESDD